MDRQSGQSQGIGDDDDSDDGSKDSKDGNDNGVFETRFSGSNHSVKLTGCQESTMVNFTMVLMMMTMMMKMIMMHTLHNQLFR